MSHLLAWIVKNQAEITTPKVSNGLGGWKAIRLESEFI